MAVLGFFLLSSNRNLRLLEQQILACRFQTEAGGGSVVWGASVHGDQGGAAGRGGAGDALDPARRRLLAPPRSMPPSRPCHPVRPSWR